MANMPNFLMVVDRLDPNYNVQCEIARDPPPLGPPRESITQADKTKTRANKKLGQETLSL